MLEAEPDYLLPTTKDGARMPFLPPVALSPLTEMISALEMLGAMLRMNREQVLWRGRGLHSSPGVSLGFSLSSSLGFSFSLSASSMQEAVGVGEFLLSMLKGKIEKLSNSCYVISPKAPPPPLSISPTVTSPTPIQ